MKILGSYLVIYLIYFFVYYFLIPPLASGATFLLYIIISLVMIIHVLVKKGIRFKWKIIYLIVVIPLTFAIIANLIVARTGGV
jgi:hypothetical protein